jgi:hypothetical protein
MINYDFLNAAWSVMPSVDIRESLRRANEIVMKQRPVASIKQIWVTADANVHFMKKHGLDYQSDPTGQLKFYGLPLVVFNDQLDMMSQAWRYDLSEVIALATTPEGGLCQVNFFKCFGEVRT